MKKSALIGFGVLAATVAISAAHADTVSAGVLLNGSLFSATPNSMVGYNPLAPESNFGAPTNQSDAIAYNIFLRADAKNYYGLFVTDPSQGGSSVGAFANIYLDLDPQNGNGSDLGFETGNHQAFIPGVSGYAATPEISFATNGSAIGFAIPISDLTGPIPGLSYYSGQAFPDAANPYVTLRLSQSFGYSVAGGPLYGPDRLGTVQVVPSAVAEPASVALLAAGVIGCAVIRRKRFTT